MLLLDKLFTWPASGLLWVVQELQQAAMEERTAEADGLRAELRELYLELEAGRISEEAFDAQEGELLDRLDSVEELLRQEAVEDDEEEDEDDEEEDLDEEESD